MRIDIKDLLSIIKQDAEALAKGETTVEEILWRRNQLMIDEELENYVDIVSARAMVNTRNLLIEDLRKFVNRHGNLDDKGE